MGKRHWRRRGKGCAADIWSSDGSSSGDGDDTVVATVPVHGWRRHGRRWWKVAETATLDARSLCEVTKFHLSPFLLTQLELLRHLGTRVDRLARLLLGDVHRL